jgi:hypothetical protein
MLLLTLPIADSMLISVDRKVLRLLKNGSLRYSFWGKYTKVNSLAP